MLRICWKNIFKSGHVVALSSYMMYMSDAWKELTAVRRAKKQIQKVTAKVMWLPSPLAQVQCQRYGEWNLICLMSQEEACTTSRPCLRLGIAYLDLSFWSLFFPGICMFVSNPPDRWIYRYYTYSTLHGTDEMLSNFLWTHWSSQWALL